MRVASYLGNHTYHQATSFSVDFPSFLAATYNMSSVRDPTAESVMAVGAWDGDREGWSSYLTFAVILLPSFLAVVVPVVPNAPASSDLALLITDTLTVVSVAWLVKFLVDWPWRWLQEIGAAKQKVINRVNSLIISGNAGDTVESFTTIWRLIRLERWVLGGCFVGVAASGGLMVGVRRYVIVEPSRRAIVFSDVNVCIFIVWSSFRLVMMVMEGIRRGSLDLNEYGLVTAENSGWWWWQGYESGRRPEERTRRHLGADLDRPLRADFKPFPLNLVKQPLAESTARDVSPFTRGSVKLTRDVLTQERMKLEHVKLEHIKLEHVKLIKSRQATGARLGTIFESEYPVVALLPVPVHFKQSLGQRSLQAHQSHRSKTTPAHTTISLHGHPSKSNIASISRNTKSSDSNYSLALELAKNNLVAVLQSIGSRYEASDLMKHPAMMMELYSEVSPLVSQMLKRELMTCLADEVVNYEIRKLGNYLKDVQMVQKYFVQLISNTGKGMTKMVVMGALVITWTCRYSTKVFIRVPRKAINKITSWLI